MPKSFFQNELVHPLLATLLVAAGLLLPLPTLADEGATPFQEVADYQTLMKLPQESRDAYMNAIRTTLLDFAERDAGTEFEFWGGNDADAQISNQGWRGGYYAILNAFTSEASAQDAVDQSDAYVAVPETAQLRDLLKRNREEERRKLEAMKGSSEREKDQVRSSFQSARIKLVAIDQEQVRSAMAAKEKYESATVPTILDLRDAEIKAVKGSGAEREKKIADLYRQYDQKIRTVNEEQIKGYKARAEAAKSAGTQASAVVQQAKTTEKPKMSEAEYIKMYTKLLKTAPKDPGSAEYKKWQEVTMIPGLKRLREFYAEANGKNPGTTVSQTLKGDARKKAQTAADDNMVSTCPPGREGFRNAKNENKCFVTPDPNSKQLTETDKCRESGGILAQHPEVQRAQCLDKKYYDLLRGEDKKWTPANSREAQEQKTADTEALKQKLCAVPKVTCPAYSKTDKRRNAARKAAYAKAKRDRCINSGNLSKFSTGKSENPSSNIRGGRCNAVTSKTFGGVTVSCDSTKTNLTLCAPDVYDTEELYDGSKKEIRGRCVPRGRSATRACDTAYRQAQEEQKKANPATPRKKFWENEIPGMEESFNERVAELNQTCGNSAVRAVQCQECRSLQTTLSEQNRVMACKKVPLPPKRPGEFNHTTTGTSVE